MLPDDEITGIDYDEELEAVVVRTVRTTDYEDKLAKKVLTSGCAQGTLFGDVMEKFDSIVLDPEARLRTSWMYGLLKAINTMPSLYLAAGAIHGCVLCEEDRPLIYMEDVGRHNAVDKIAGYMLLKRLSCRDKILYTTGRLTSEMVLKTVQMEIPILISRSGFTAWGRSGAPGRADADRPGARQAVRRPLGEGRIIYDADPERMPDESPALRRKPCRRCRLTSRRFTAFCWPAGSAGGWGRRQVHAAGPWQTAAGARHRTRIAAGGGIGDQRQRRSLPLRAYSLPVATDVVDGFVGPLAGVLTGLEWVRAHAPGCAG